MIGHTEVSKYLLDNKPNQIWFTENQNHKLNFIIKFKNFNLQNVM